MHGDAPEMEPVWHALRGRAALLLSGHDHSSQRFHPRDGMVQIVAGAGGREFYPVRPDPRVAFANAREPAAVRLTLAPTRARIAFVATDGRRLDVSEVPCRR